MESTNNQKSLARGLQSPEAFLSILRNELKLRKSLLLSFLAIAIFSLIILGANGLLSGNTPMWVLFFIEIPVFAYVLADKSFAYEKEKGSWEFLSRLPISKSQIMITKHIFAVCAAMIAYLLFGILYLLLGSDVSLAKALARDYAWFVALPIAAIAYGMFTAVLPKGVGVISSIVLAVVGFFTLNDLNAWANLNYFWAFIIFALVFNSLSYAMFFNCKDNELNVTAAKGIGYLICGLVLCFGLWNLLGFYAEKSDKVEIAKGGMWLPLDNGKKIVWELYVKHNIVDNLEQKSSYHSEPSSFMESLNLVFADYQQKRKLFVQDLEKSTLKEINSRNSGLLSDVNVWNNDGATDFVAAYAEDMQFGLAKGFKAGLIDKDGRFMSLVKPFSKNSYKQFKFVDNTRVVYLEETRKEAYSCFLYDVSKGITKLFDLSAEEKFLDWVVIPAKGAEPAQVLLLAYDSLKKASVLISAANEQRVVLPLTNNNPNVRAIGKNFMIIDDGLWGEGIKESKNLLVKYDGSIEDLSWIGDNGKVIGITSANKIIALLPVAAGRDKTQSGFVSIVEADVENRNVKEICNPGFPVFVRSSLSKDWNWAVFNLYKDLKGTWARTFGINLQTGYIKDFAELNDNSDRQSFVLHNGPFSTSGSRFMLGGFGGKNGLSGVIEVDAASGEVKNIVKYSDVVNLIK